MFVFNISIIKPNHFKNLSLFTSKCHGKHAQRLSFIYCMSSHRWHKTIENQNHATSHRTTWRQLKRYSKSQDYGTVNASTLALKKCSCRIDFDKGASKISLIGNVNSNERNLSSCETPMVHYASHGFMVDVEKSYLDNKFEESAKENLAKTKVILNEIELLKYTQHSLLYFLNKKNTLRKGSSDLSNDSSVPVVEEIIANASNTQAKEFQFSKLPQYYASLSKSRLTGLVVLTAMAGYTMAPGVFDPLAFATVSLGTAFTSSSANSINQILEVKHDGIMARTKNRVLVKGLLSPLHVLTFGALCGGTGISLLYFGVNELTGVLGALNLIIYTSIYTPMKQISIANTWIGSVVGAIPPLMGWAACTGSLSPGAFVLGGVLYAWQFPHFNALSWNIRHEYNKAGYKMMASLNPELCRKTALRYSAALIPLCLIAPIVDLTTWTFAFDSLPINIYFTYLAWKFYKEADSKTSRQLFRFSLFHLPALMLLMLISKKDSDAEESRIENKTVAIGS